MLLRQRYSALLGGHSMTKIASLPTIVGALLALGLSAAPAQAAPNRTWVSGHGTDSGACTLAAPCRTFAFALTQTGGEIDVLDLAGYGPVTITKAISIVNDGVGVAAIGSPTNNGVTINAGASDSVHLRGLTIDGGPGVPGILGTGGNLAVGVNGILFNTGGNLAIENCVVRSFLGAGIAITPSTSSSFSVSNTIVSDNEGILVSPTGSAVVSGVLSEVITNSNGVGIVVNGAVTTGASLNVTIVDSVASNNPGFGVEAVSSSGHAATAVMLRNVVASYSGTGLSAGQNAILRVAHSVVTGNGLGVNGYGERAVLGLAAAAGGVRVEYKKPLTGRAKCVMPPGQGQKSQSLEWEETKPELIINIQANLGGGLARPRPNAPIPFSSRNR
jgi:hypothetical protein